MSIVVDVACISAAAGIVVGAGLTTWAYEDYLRALKRLQEMRPLPASPASSSEEG